ncbi:DNA cytosine methyltransferase [Moorena sp. SIO3A2]|uniref:DNA cytosine methyltransferase n=1 Tax=Moorena sp. SIO3A2 TaxID=2607841 RepID=UPI00338E1A52
MYGFSEIRTIGLFEGIGGFPYAAEQIGGFLWEGSVENDPSAIKVLERNFSHPLFGDIRSFHPKPGEYDFMVGGFPCSGTSSAGDKTGLDHPESSLYTEFIRCVEEGRPSMVLLEQPEGFIYRGYETWVEKVSGIGYEVLDPIIFGCHQIGGSYRRVRIFSLSYAPDRAWNIRQGRWQYQVRTLVEEFGASAEWLTIERSGDAIATRLPAGLSGTGDVCLHAPYNQKGRNEARRLIGQTVSVPQAALALSAAKWVWYQRWDWV